MESWVTLSFMKSMTEYYNYPGSLVSYVSFSCNKDLFSKTYICNKAYYLQQTGVRLWLTIMYRDEKFFY